MTEKRSRAQALARAAKELDAQIVKLDQEISCSAKPGLAHYNIIADEELLFERKLRGALQKLLAELERGTSPAQLKREQRRLADFVGCLKEISYLDRPYEEIEDKGLKELLMHKHRLLRAELNFLTALCIELAKLTHSQ